MRLPDQVGRWALLAGAVVWAGAACGRTVGWWATAGALGFVVGLAAFAKSEWAALAILAVAATVSGTSSVEREQAVLETLVPEGVVEVRGTVVDDARSGSIGCWFFIRPDSIASREQEAAWRGPPLLVSSDEDVVAIAGETVVVFGRLIAEPGTARGDAYAGRMMARRVEHIAHAQGFFRAANLVRSRVALELAPSADRPAAALVSGFLIGDIRELPAADADALRRAGLSHYVAVSGSNVALFLMLWWVLVGPLGFGPRRRALIGLVGLILFAIVTRWEPSVLRASVMAGLVLAARASGWSIGPWTALGGGIAGLLLVSGELVSDVGFQLSVAATAGVIAGAGYRPLRRFPLVGATLAATISAQLAVAPLLLTHFGTLPILSPLTNLLAGPLVATATAFGGLGVLSGLDVLVGAATAVSGVVLAIARVAAPWPQIGWIGYCGLLTAIGIGRLLRLYRPMALLAAGWAFLMIGLNPSPIELPAVVFLDVGQGDSSLLLSDDGSVVLVDGGPDAGVLIERLRHYGIDRIDLLVASHQHHDHVAGLIQVMESFPIGLVWHNGHPDPGHDMEVLLEVADNRGIPIEVARPGWRARIGNFVIEVMGPLRRYVSPNEQSVVMVARIDETTILLPGDIETYAQNDLGPIPADVLKVPHQGAATSDLVWLGATRASTVVIPVGPNDYGHPAPEVVRLFEEMGAQVWRTDEDGDVVLSLRN